MRKLALATFGRQCKFFTLIPIMASYTHAIDMRGRRLRFVLGPEERAGREPPAEAGGSGRPVLPRGQASAGRVRQAQPFGVRDAEGNDGQQVSPEVHGGLLQLLPAVPRGRRREGGGSRRVGGMEEGGMDLAEEDIRASLRSLGKAWDSEASSSEEAVF